MSSKAALRVSIDEDRNSRPNRADVKTGTSADAESSEVVFDTFVDFVEVMAFDYAMYIRLVSEDGVETDQFTVPRNGSRSEAFRARGFKVQNIVAGESADYEVKGTYKA